MVAATPDRRGISVYFKRRAGERPAKPPLRRRTKNASTPFGESRANQVKKGALIFPLGCPVPFFNCLGFGYVFALLRLAVKTRALFVINMRLGVDPDETMSTFRLRYRAHGSFHGTLG